MKPALLAMDLDGTLVRRDGSIHPDDVAAIGRLREHGVVVTIATGRTPPATLHVAEQLGLQGPCVCTDGAMVVEMQGGSVLEHKPLGGAPTRALADALTPFPHIAASLLVGDTVVLDERSGVLERVATAWSPQVERTERLATHPAWQSDDGVTAAAVVGLEEHVVGILSRIEPEPIDAIVFDVPKHDGLRSLILHAAGVSKGAGLHWLAAHHDVDIRQTVVVGDWLNDVSMLSVAGRSYAMAHAPNKVQAAADDVLLASRDGGAIADIARRVWQL